MGDAAIEHFPVVADDQHGVGVFLQIALKPGRALKVEIVGRLVEQQKIRFREQDARNRGAHAPAAGELFRRSIEIGVAEPQTHQDFRRPRFRRPGINVCQPHMDLTDPVGVGRGLRLLHQGMAFGIGGQHHIENGVVRGFHLLSHPAHARALDQTDRGVRRRLVDLFPDQPQKRGLARAVAPHQTDLPAAGDLRRGVFKQRAGADAVVEI